QNSCGQSQLAAAALHLLDGVPVHSLALHSLHGDPSRTAEAALVSRFVEARRNVPSVLYLPGAHQWWDGEDAAVHPQLRTLLVNLLDDIPDTWPILVVSTWETKCEQDGVNGGAAREGGGRGGGALGDYYNMDAGGLHGAAGKNQLVNALLGGSRSDGPWGVGAFADAMSLTGDEQREGFVQEMLSTLAGTLKKAFCSRGSKAGGRAKKTPPPPLPLAPRPERPEQREEPEDEAFKKQEEHYLRELRICLREVCVCVCVFYLLVLGDLRKDRRFSMFKQIGDYEGEYMDLNGIREKLNAEEYGTLDEFEDDLKLMADEAKEVRDRLKADLARAEAHAAELESGGAGPGAAAGTAAGTAAVTGEGGGAGAPGGARSGGGGGAGGGSDEVALRRALMAVDRATNQLSRASTAVDMACFLRDAALSFLQDCVSRLGYDLEGKCKEIALKRARRGGGGGGGTTASRAGRSPSKRKGSPETGGGRRDGGSPGPVAPNYTSESVIEDIYGGVTGTGSRDRATRASRRSASADGRFVQLGDHGKLLEQGTEVEVEVVQPPRKRASRQQRSPTKRTVMFVEGGEKEAENHAAAAGLPTAETAAASGGEPVEGDRPQDDAEEEKDTAPVAAPSAPKDSLATAVVVSCAAVPGGSIAVAAATAASAPNQAPGALGAVAPGLPPLEPSTGAIEQPGKGAEAPIVSKKPSAAAEQDQLPALVVPSPEAANGACGDGLAAASVSGGVPNGAPSIAADATMAAAAAAVAAAADGGSLSRDQLKTGPAAAAAAEAFSLDGNALDGDGDALMGDAAVAAAGEVGRPGGGGGGGGSAAPVDVELTVPPTRNGFATSASPSEGGPVADVGGSGGIAGVLYAAAASKSHSPVLANGTGEQGAEATRPNPTAAAPVEAAAAHTPVVS
ncbi:unnamed protein product, partial [Scytosiphon promiscuus]